MIIGISIVKAVAFRGVQQEFANNYHYRLDSAVTAPYADLVDELVGIERPIHSTDVTFKRAAAWTAGGTPAENQMQYQAALSGTGDGPTTPGSMDRERAFLIRWPAGVDSRGKPVYLRKWFHTCGAFGGSVLWTPSDGQLQNTLAIPEVIRDAIGNYCSAFNEVGDIEQWVLCAPSGRQWQGQPQCHRYLEHHQLGDQWR